MKPEFSAGTNIAIKVPAHEYERTLSFYRDTIGLEELRPNPPGEAEAVCFRFGSMNLWVDRIAGLSQGEIWLEIRTDDLASAAEYLADKDCVRCDEVESLPESIQGFWLVNPANIVHLIHFVDEQDAN